MREPGKLIPIDGTKVPAAWLREINNLTSIVLLFQQEQDRRIPANAWTKYLHRVHTFHWLIKLKWDSKHKIPAPYGNKDTYKPLEIFTNGC